MVALRRACQKLKRPNLNDCSVYAICHPCPMCLAALIYAQPKAIYFAVSPEDKKSMELIEIQFCIKCVSHGMKENSPCFYIL